MSLLLSVLGLGYLVPSVIAAYRDHADARLVVLLNVLLGWTLVGWIAALVWACTGAADVQPVATRGDRVASDGSLTLEGCDPRHRDSKGGPIVGQPGRL